MARLHSTTRPAVARGGFTLIELMIAVLIISILATLVTLGVSKAMSYAKQVATKTEMGQIEQALGVAAIEMGRVPYIPSAIVLKKIPSLYGTSTLDSLSKRVLTQMFPKWTDAVPASWPEVTLGPDQAYIFFLRGIDGSGFSASAQDPCASGGKRFGPYFEFKANRLVPGNGGLPKYKDYWENSNAHLIVYSQMMVGQPTFNASNIYDGKFDEISGYPRRQIQAFNPATKVGKYFMPKGYQIFSAGKDGGWGTYPDNLPAPGNPPANVFNGLLLGLGEDDQSNFADEPHGKPIND